MSTDNIDHETTGKDHIPFPPGAIGIDAVYQLVASPLTNCFFQKEGQDNYSMFRLPDKPGDPPILLVSGIANHQRFPFESFELKVHFFMDKENGEEKAHGTWKLIIAKEEGGTFTAQAGGGSGVPTGKSASA